ncbi:MAG: GTP-binding protein TypA/BipA [Parcubacteria group bacterium GW2011_GWA2_43_11]|nr:MAG: GTP-binding protein TypA/BipA [Parcubacteria group bacterium GW2011_GWC2_42_11]KKS86407.1 MAG: GTP-binding protein TypA/BipA [Parcubacteria group bacterium GW2011_GWA2_43_11]
MEPTAKNIRNVAIIAHVDHGKTTLTDALLRQTNAVGEGVSMDSNTLEKERGITIYSKNAACIYKDTKINIVDTPGHADFGSEVERVLRSIDSVLLVVDAQEGPMPQTRFVLKKSLELGHRPIVVINKIDKPAANIDRTHDQVFDLFSELGATNEQLDFPTILAIGREGIAKKNLEDVSTDLTPLLDLILEHVPAPKGDDTAILRAQPFNLAYDNYLGRLGIVRVYDGTISEGDTIFAIQEGKTTKGKITKLFSFEGLTRVETKKVCAGDIAIVAGLPDIFIGETLSTSPDTEPLPMIAVDEPTIELTFLINDSPFAGREGKFVTSRQLRSRLEKELEVNVGLKIDFESTSADRFIVRGRGELHIAILLEYMRREGYEMQVSQPQVIFKEEDGKKLEPYEEVTIDTPEVYQGSVIEKLGTRGTRMLSMEQKDGHVRLVFDGPTRGLFGYRSQFVIDTKGEGIISTRVVGFRPYAGELRKRQEGSMISQVTGKVLAYSLDNLQTRGTLYIKENVEVYEGQVIGNTSRGEEMVVNPTKGKNLTNVRSSGTDEAIKLIHPKLLTIENGLELMAGDEYLEITPKSVRLRKQHLTEIGRTRSKRS